MDGLAVRAASVTRPDGSHVASLEASLANRELTRASLLAETHSGTAESDLATWLADQFSLP
eukprot:m.51653 g.51653  ORF g.51653 m.51653 type:complete len:61 (-) comp11719_c0_seq1:53-235(-)